MAENHFQALIDACGNNTSEDMRPLFAQAALKAYDTYCPHVGVFLTEVIDYGKQGT